MKFSRLLLAAAIPLCSLYTAQAMAAQPAVMSASISEKAELETVAAFGNHMAIGLSVNSQNRVFTGFPGADGDGNLSLVEIKDGKLTAYPDKAWNEKGDYGSHFLRVQDLFVDSNDMLWVLDSKPSPSANVFRDEAKDVPGQFKLVKINTKTDQVEKVYLFDDLDKARAGLNDMRIDTEKNYAYFSDPGMSAIVVLNLETEKTRVLLKGSPYTTIDKDFVLTYDGTVMQDKNGNPFTSAVNGIALTHDFKYFYFKPINKAELFRIETRYLADESLSDQDVAKHVEEVAKVGVTHGLVADKSGNVYLTTSEDYSISYITPKGEIKRLVQDPRILWPDSLGVGSDGYLYFTCAQLQLLAQWSGGKDRTAYPYRAYRVKLPS